MIDNVLNSGSLLQGGKYKIIDVLGQGGFGITYEAEQVSLRRKVAVKEFFMKDSCERDENTSHVTVPTARNREIVSKFKDKFIREARMIAGLDHEHIVKIFDVFEENGTAYYVMEYIGGGCLGDGVKAGRAMPEREAVESIRQIASALKYLHNKGIIHFDVKPSNVLRTEDGKLKLIDFGISKHYDEAGVQTSSTPVGISKGYAPLEQYQQGSDIKSFTPATDIYSLGATLFALLTGGNPPEASIIYEDGLPVIDGVSPKAMHAIEKAMQPRRKDRPQSVAEFLTLLDGTVTEDDDEQTIVPTPAVKEPNPEKAESLARKSSKPKKSEEKKSKGFPKWIYGLIAGIIAASLIAITIPMLLPKEGKIFFGSEPRGAEVWLDGEASGKITPCTLSGIPYGTHSIRYKLDGYCECNDSISVSGRRIINYFDTLKVAFGKLEVKCSQQGMELFVDGVPTGKKTKGKSILIDSVLVGTHIVELKLKDYKICRLEVNVKENETSQLMAKAEYIWPAPSGKENGHGYMDLGLSVKWATCNVGASSPEGYGSYFAWGETSPKSYYGWSTYAYCNGSSVSITKYCTEPISGTVDNKTRLELSDDAARANWGGSWRIPTLEEQEELFNNCLWQWTTQNGHNGYKVTSKINGNSIFLPAAGWRVGNSRESHNVGLSGHYWSSSLDPETSSYVRYLIFLGWAGDSRAVGRSVRPVCP